MKRPLLLLVFAALLLSQPAMAAEPLPTDSTGAIWIGLNLTTQEQLPAGRYFFLRVDPATGEYAVTVIDMEGDNPPPPPPPDDLKKQIDALLAQVTDAEKVETAGQVAQVYDLLVAQVDAGTITDIETLRKAGSSVTIMLGLLGKGAAWKPFTDGMTALLSGCTDLAKCKQILVVASERLKAVQNAKPAG